MAIDWEGGAYGAGTGAAIGSLGGPVGTVVGGGAGFILGSGMLGGGMMGGVERKANRQMLAVDPADQQRQLQMRGQQGMWNDEMRRRAMGQGPSVAEQQMAAGMGQQVNAARSAAASGRGGNAALAQRAAGQQAAMGQANVIRDAGMLRAQEMQTAGQAYGQGLDQQRAADLQARGMSFQEANAQLEADKERERLEMERATGNAERRQKGIGGLMSAAGGALSDIKAKENVQPLYSDFRDKETMQLNPQSEMPSFGQQLRETLGQPQQQPIVRPLIAAPPPVAKPEEKREKPEDDSGDAMGGALSMLGGSLMSDYTQKEPPTARFPEMDPVQQQWSELESAVTADENRRAFDPIQPVAYQYKPEASARMALETGATPEERAMVYEDKRTPRRGIIAQDLEQSPAYAPAVVETPAGKAVDRDRALSETLAQAAGFDKRIKELEAYLQSRGAKKMDDKARVTPRAP